MIGKKFDEIGTGIFWYLLHRYFGKDAAVLSSPASFESIVTKEGIRYRVSEMALGDISSALHDYDFSDIRPTDIVLDIGAGHGGFALPAAKKAKWVYAVEPLFFQDLRENAALNGIENVTVIPVALGDGSDREIEYAGMKKSVRTASFGDLEKACSGHIDVLKCDCEGGEWYIPGHRLKSIRRLEIELHNSENRDPDLVTSIRHYFPVVKESPGPNNFAYLIVHGYQESKDLPETGC